jgi:SAM-dependent methyltransferase
MSINLGSEPWYRWHAGQPVPHVEKDLLFRMKHGRVLDFGCGTGRGISRFQSYGWETVGIDVFLPAKRPLTFGDVAKASGQFLPFQSEVFDVILLAQVLHHLPNPQLALSEVKRCLKKNGFLLIGENIENNCLLRLSRSLYPSHDGMDTLSDYSRFRKNDLRRLIQKSDFEILNESTGVILWVSWYELAKRLSFLRPLSLFIKKLDHNLETVLPKSHAQYYCLCAKTVS